MEDWRSRWYASKHEFSDLLVEDFKIRKFIKGKYSFAGIPKIEIERTRDAVTVLLFTARPGVIIGRKGAEVEKLQEELQDADRPPDRDQDRRGRPARDRRAADQRGHRRAAPEAVELPPHDEAVARADDGRRRQGASRSSSPAGSAARRCRGPRRPTSARSPCRTLRAKIDYGFSEAKTAQGHIGIKVWVNQGDYLKTEGGPMPMMPKRVKYRKSQKGRVRGNATRGNYVAFGEYGLQALEPGRISAADDRGRPRRRQPVGQGGRQALHPDLPPQERHLDPRRDPHGQGQGRGRVLGGRRQARARSSTRSPASARSSPAPPSPASPTSCPCPAGSSPAGPRSERIGPIRAVEQDRIAEESRHEQARRTPRADRRAARAAAQGDADRTSSGSGSRARPSGSRRPARSSRRSARSPGSRRSSASARSSASGRSPALTA